MSIVVDPTPFYKKLSFNLLSIGLLTLLLYVGQDILVPFFFAILLASMLLPVITFLERKGIHQVVAIAVALSISMIIMGAVFYFLVTQIVDFLDDLPAIQERLENLSSVTQKWVRETFHVTIRKQNQYINESTLKMKGSGLGILQQTFVTVTEVLSYLVLLPLYTFLILYYRNMIRKFLGDILKHSSAEEVRGILLESQAVSHSFIAGLMIEMTIVFVLNATGFLILGIKYAVFLALVAALLNLLPYIGMLIANILCMVITLISSEVLQMGDVVWVGIILAVVQFIDNNFLMTLVVGSKVRINSLATVLGVLVGGALCGVPGMFLSIPGLALLKVIFDRSDALKPFGMLLGDESPVRKRK